MSETTEAIETTKAATGTSEALYALVAEAIALKAREEDDKRQRQREQRRRTIDEFKERLEIALPPEVIAALPLSYRVSFGGAYAVVTVDGAELLIQTSGVYYWQLSEYDTVFGTQGREIAQPHRGDLQQAILVWIGEIGERRKRAAEREAEREALLAKQEAEKKREAEREALAARARANPLPVIIEDGDDGAGPSQAGHYGNDNFLILKRSRDAFWVQLSLETDNIRFYQMVACIMRGDSTRGDSSMLLWRHGSSGRQIRETFSLSTAEFEALMAAWFDRETLFVPVEAATAADVIDDRKDDSAGYFTFDDDDDDEAPF